MQIAPYLSRPIERTSEGMLGAIKWKQISEKYLIPLVSGGSWRFLYVVVDSSADNYKMMRSIIAETTQRTRLIVVFSPCFAHALSLMVKWSFGKNFKYGCMLRTQFQNWERSILQSAYFIPLFDKIYANLKPFLIWHISMYSRRKGSPTQKSTAMRCFLMEQLRNSRLPARSSFIRRKASELRGAPLSEWLLAEDPLLRGIK